MATKRNEVIQFVREEKMDWMFGTYLLTFLGSMLYCYFQRRWHHSFQGSVPTGLRKPPRPGGAGGCATAPRQRFTTQPTIPYAKPSTLGRGA